MIQALPLVMMAIGTGLGVSGALASGKMQAGMFGQEAEVAARNAGIVREQAAQEEAAFRRVGTRTLRAMRAAYGASGVTMEGSASDVMEDSAAQIELDALNVRYRGEITAMGYEDSADMARRRGEAAIKESRYRAASALFGGLGNMLGGGGRGLFG